MLHDFQNLSHLPLAADVDIGQVIFVIVFLVVAFVQWLIKVIKEKAEAATRSQQMPTEEEAEARRRAWSEQTPKAETMPAPQQQQPTRTGGGTLSDLFGEVRKAIDEATHPKPPPPLPRPTSAPAPAPSRSRTPSPAPVVPASSPLLVSDLTSSSGAPIRTEFPKRRAHPLTRLLHTPEGYQQAFILREVLGPPRAYQEYRGPED